MIKKHVSKLMFLKILTNINAMTFNVCFRNLKEQWIWTKTKPKNVLDDEKKQSLPARYVWRGCVARKWENTCFLIITAVWQVSVLAMQKRDTSF